VSARDTESFYQAYAHIARQLNIPGWDDDKANVKNLVQHYLCKERSGPWLLVFDIADDVRAESVGSFKAASLIDWLPSSKLKAIVFTMTDRKMAAELVSQIL
jgi:hypothetical protein